MVTSSPENKSFSADDPRVLLSVSTNHDRYLSRLYKISTDEELEQLALLAHSQPGFSCGNIELVGPQFPLIDGVTKTLPPIYPESVALPSVSKALEKPDEAQIRATIQTLQDLGTRYHTGTTNAPSSVQKLFQNASSAAPDLLSIQSVTHTYTTQPSLVASIAGTSDNDTTVVIGAHLDSINRSDLTNAPGADDDASGIATMVEAVRVIANSGWKFQRRVEFQAYAAEEVGLIGSKEIAAQYVGKRNIAAMLQLDMDSWSHDATSNTIYSVSTDTYVNLRRSLKDLMNAYLGGGFSEMTLASGTSDHKAWTNNGFPAVFPFENPSDYNEALHTSRDTLTTINNLPLAKRFTQLVLAFLAHYAGLNGADTEYQNSAATLLPQNKDLYVAIADGDTADSYKVSISASEETEGVEFCPMSAANATGCNKDRAVLTALGTKNGRKIFQSANSRSVADGEFWRLYGYDGNEKLIAQRTIKLSKK